MGPSNPETAWLYSPLAQDPELSELVDLFVAEMPERTSNLLARLQTEDWEELRRAVHQLRGAAGSYGFPALTPSATRLEEAITSGEPKEEILRAVEELVGLCRRVRRGTP